MWRSLSIVAIGSGVTSLADDQFVYFVSCLPPERLVDLHQHVQHVRAYRWICSRSTRALGIVVLLTTIPQSSFFHRRFPLLAQGFLPSRGFQLCGCWRSVAAVSLDLRQAGSVLFVFVNDCLPPPALPGVSAAYPRYL